MFPIARKGKNPMGFIKALNQAKATTKFPGADTGKATWREIFGTTSKEPEPKPVSRQSIAGGPRPNDGYGRSIAGADAATKRLIQAMRSMAPGGWSDDRYAESKHFHSIPYVAIHRKCIQLQQSEFQVFKKDPSHPEGKRPVTEDDPPEPGFGVTKPYDLVKLLKRPNKQDSFGKMMYRILQQKDLTGMALTWMVPNELGVPFEMYTIPTCIAIPQPAINPDYPDGYWRIQPVYPYGPFSSYPTPTTAVGAPIPAQWMLRMMYPHPILRYDGFSPLTGVNLQTDEIESIDTARFNRMRRSYGMSATLDMSGLEGQEGLPEPEIDRLRAELENSFEGPQNTGKIFIPPPGTEMKPYEYNAELGYHDDWDQLASFLMGGGFGITKPAAGMVEDSSYSTLYATLQQLYIITLQPEADDIAAEFTHHLAPFFGEDLIIEIRCKRVNDHEISFGKVDKLVTLKGLPKAVIRTALKLMDMPVDEDLVEELSAAQEEQPGMPGAPGAVPPGAAGEEEGPKPPPDINKDEEEPEAVTQSRPKPSPMQSRGSLGPRKELMKALKAKYYTVPKRTKGLKANGKALNGVHKNGKH